MIELRPTFSLMIGDRQASTANSGGVATHLVVERGMRQGADGLRIRIAHRGDVMPGEKVRLDLGFDGVETTVFTGELQSARPSTGDGELWALGGLVGLQRLRVGAVFEAGTVGAIVRDVSGRAAMPVGTVDDGPTLPRYVADPRISAYEHLRALADRLGVELYATVDGTVMFHGLADPLAAPRRTAGHGRDVLAAGARRELAGWTGVQVGGESPVSGQGDRTVAWLTADDAGYRGSAGQDPRTVLVLDPAARTKDLADRFAAGLLCVAHRGTSAVRATVPGRPDVDLGDVVRLTDGPDELLRGTGYVRALRHRLGPDWGFVTDLTLSVPA